MATMYKKLGELLSESLEKGEVLQFTKEDAFSEEKFDIFSDMSSSEEEKSSEKKKSSAQNDSSSEKLNSSFQKSQSQGKRSRTQNDFSSAKEKKGIVYKVLPPEVERAYRLLDITVSASVEDIKKAYKEKLKYYHPDRHQNNEVLQKVATNKTKQIVEAFNILMNYRK